MAVIWPCREPTCSLTETAGVVTKATRYKTMMKTASRQATPHRLTLSTVLAAGFAICASATVSATAIQHTFTTDLKEVRTGHFNGTEFLTIEISDDTGPAGCRGNVLHVAVTNTDPEEPTQQEIEKIALSAMLNSDQVLITVPVGFADCIDGKPTVVDIYPINDYSVGAQ